MAPSHPSASTTTTSFLLANLHCPTCVSTIKDALLELPGIQWVSPNVVTSWVAVEHDSSVPITQMASTLGSAGFEVSSISSSNGDESLANFMRGDSTNVIGDRQMTNPGDVGQLDGALDRITKISGKLTQAQASAAKEQKAQTHLNNCEQCRTQGAKPDGACSGGGTQTGLDDKKKSGMLATAESLAADEDDKTFTDNPRKSWTASLAVAGMTCASCVNTITEELNKQDWITKVTVNLIGNSAMVEYVGDKSDADRVVESIEDLGYDAHLDEVTPVEVHTAWRASLAIAGMTCASCVNAITKELNKHGWITKTTINLISNSGVVEYTGSKEDADEIVDRIEDLGYDAHLDQVAPIDDGKDTSRKERTVDIHIDGFYCQHCPDRLERSLAGFRHDLKVVNRPTFNSPFMKITYVPEVPVFTIRRILAAIEASDPSFKASIYHPPTLEERSKRIHAHHQKQILLRVVFTFIVAIPTFVIGIVYMNLVADTDAGRRLLMEPWTSGISRAQMALFIMATPVYFLAADLFHRRAVKEIKSLWRPGSRTPILQRFYRFGSMNMLMSLGTTVAYVSSVSQMIAAAVDSAHQLEDSNFYFDSVVFLTLFLLCGRLIEAYSKSKTGDAVEALGKLRPTSAILVEGGDEKKTDQVVSTDLLDYGDTVRIPHGASPPCDGTVIQGETTFDESSLTGESRPVKKKEGDEIFSGTVNKGTPILIRITGVAGQSMLDQIVNVVREGQTKRAPMERLADLLTAYFVPVITLIAVITWLTWLICGLAGAIPGHYLDVSSGGWVAFSLQFSIAVFVVACPCGLALAAPTAIFVGGGLAAKHGILVKGGGEAFEKASKVDCIVFDKTGTLTVGGEPKITDSEVFPGVDVSKEQRNVILAALRAVEENSSHPIAKAIVAFCRAETAEQVIATDVEEIPGKGLKATYSTGVDNETSDIIVGNEALMRDFAVPITSTVASSLQTWKTEAKSVALAATKPSTAESYQVAAAVSISDPIRAETPKIVAALRAAGTDVWMLSGDNATTARAVALRIGIPESNVIAEVLPTQKADKIAYLQATLKARHRGFLGRGVEENVSQRATIAMVGDGINDAPALARADVGVAVGSGSDVAIASADFVLVKSHLGAVVTLLSLSRTVFRRIKFNFGWALVYNLLAVPVAAGCFYPIVVGGTQHVRLDPVWASLAMALSSISVVLSSLALRSRLPFLGVKVVEVDYLESPGRVE